MKTPKVPRATIPLGKRALAALCAVSLIGDPLHAGSAFMPPEPVRRTPPPPPAPIKPAPIRPPKRVCTASGTVTIRPGNDGYDELRKCVRSLDALRSKIEEWGTVTISAPVAVIEAGAFEIPAEILTPADMFTKVLAERNASVFQSTERLIRNSFSATLKPTVSTNVVTTDETGKLTSTKTTTTSDNTPSDASLAGDTDLSKLGPNAAVNPFTGLTNMTAPSMTVMDAQQQTDNNLMQQRIFSQLGKNHGIKGHSTVLFCIVQVSCNPGWRTKESYIGDCSSSLEYYNISTKEHLPQGEQRAPKVFSVLPLMDAHTVEMANSQRDVTSLAIQLAGSMAAHGVNINAKNLFEFVKRYSRDMRSVTPMPVVNSYSSGATFGFRFSPSFQALRDPAQKNTKAANVLLPRSFPALITVVLEDVDVDFAARRLTPNKEYDRNASKDNLPFGFAINTHTSTRWYLKDRPQNWELQKWLFSRTRRDTASLEVGMAEHLAEFYNAKACLKDFDLHSRRSQFSPIYDELRREVIDLESKGLGRDWPIPLEKDFFTKLAALEKSQQEQAAQALEKAGKKQTNEALDSANRRIAELNGALDTAHKELTERDIIHLKEENNLLRQLLKTGPRVAAVSEEVAVPPRPAPARIASEPPTVERPPGADEGQLRLDDILPLPEELNNRTFRAEPLPPLPPASAAAPRKPVARATSEPTLTPLPLKKAGLSALKPHLALERTTAPFHR